MIDNILMVLDTIIEHPDEGDTTLRQYLQLLLKTLFRESDGFSGKRPLGNSGWEIALAVGLVKAKLLKGKLVYDRNGDVEDVEFKWTDFNRLINDAIEAL